MNIASMALFSLHQFMQVDYFKKLLAASTISATIIQVLGAMSFHVELLPLHFLRAALIGMWTTSTCAAGLLGFERQRETLSYLYMGSKNEYITIATIVASASLFGCLALIIASCSYATLSYMLFAQSPISVLLSTLQALPLFLLAWLSAYAISLIVAALFVLTPNAISYEGLLLLPMLMLSGIAAPLTLNAALDLLLCTVNPLYYPTSLLLYGKAAEPTLSACYVIGLIVWFCLFVIALRFAFRRARKDASLELI